MMATATAPPPSYELPGSEPSSGDSLPDYSPRAARASRPTEEREFEYKAERKKGETVASLKVLAPAMYSKNIPTFCGAGPVKGSAHLYLKEPDTITSVVVSVSSIFVAPLNRPDDTGFLRFCRSEVAFCLGSQTKNLSSSKY